MTEVANSSSLRHIRRLSATVALAVARNRAQPRAVDHLRDPRLGRPDIAPHVLAACSYHGITPLLWDAQQHTPTPPGLAERTQDEYRAIVARGLRLTVAADALADVFDAAGIGYAMFKGSAVASYYPRMTLRYGSDVDVLVEAGDMPAADSALTAAGFAPLGRGWEGQVKASVAECTYLFGDYGNVDLHWHVIADTPVRDAFQVSTAKLIARARPSTFGRRPIPVLDHTDMFLTVATHACFSGAFRLGWLVDLAVLLDDPLCDWDMIAARAHETGTALPVQIMLDRAARTLGDLDAPPLINNAWRRTVDRASVLWPAYRGSDQLVRGAFIYRATRATTAKSMWSLVNGLPWDAGTRIHKRRQQIRAV